MKNNKILFLLTFLTIVVSIYIAVEFSVVYASELEEPVKEYKFYKDWRVWAAAITTVVATVAVILIFKRGGGDDGSSSGGSTEGLKEVLKPDTQQTSTNLSVELPQNLTKSAEDSVVNKTLEVATELSESNPISQNAVVNKVLDSVSKLQESNVTSQDSVLNTTAEVSLKASESAPEIINVISQNAAEIATAAATVITFKLYGVDTPITIDPEYSAEVISYINKRSLTSDSFFFSPFLYFTDLIANLTNITTFFEYRFPQSHPLYRYQLNSKDHWTYLIDKISTQGIQDREALAGVATRMSDNSFFDSFKESLAQILRCLIMALYKSIQMLILNIKYNFADQIKLIIEGDETYVLTVSSQFYVSELKHIGEGYDSFWTKIIIFDLWVNNVYYTFLILQSALKDIHDTVGIDKALFLSALGKVLDKVLAQTQQGWTNASIKEAKDGFKEFRRNHPLEDDTIHDRFSSAIKRISQLIKEYFKKRK